MNALVFLGDVVAPVVGEVVVAVDGSQLEDRFGAVEAPAGAGEVHAVLDEVATGAFDDAGGDGPACCERGRVVEVGRLVDEVGGADVGVGASGGFEAVAGGFASDGRGDLFAPSGEDGMGLVADPGFGGGGAFIVEGPGGAP